MRLTRSTRGLGALLLVPVMLCVGCKDHDIGKAVQEFRTASSTLAAAYGIFVANANTVEEENYINSIVATPAAFDLNAMQGADLMTPEEVAIRGAAVKALGDYLAALATLEGGGSSAQIETDAAAAGTSLATLDTDANAAIAKHLGKSPVDFSAPLSAAVSAIGSVLKLILAHEGRLAVRKSILQNDPAVKALFVLISKESKLLYARQKSVAGGQRNAVVGAFDAEARRAGATPTPGLVELGERLKATPRTMALAAQADPSDAIDGFEKTHDALMKVVTDDGRDETSLRALFASAQSFATTVGPLSTNVLALAASF